MVSMPTRQTYRRTDRTDAGRYIMLSPVDATSVKIDRKKLSSDQMNVLEDLKDCPVASSSYREGLTALKLVERIACMIRMETNTNVFDTG